MPLALLVAAAVVPGAVERPLRAGALVLVSTALLALAAVVARRGRGRVWLDEVVLATCWAAGVLLALVVAAQAVDPALVRQPAVLGVAGVGALAYAVLPRRLPWCAGGLALATLAWWTRLGATSSPTLEWWTLPPALLALAVGALVWWRLPALPTWVVLGPGLVVGLLPSAVLSAQPDGDPLRLAGVLAACVVLCALGWSRAWQAPLVCGAVAALVVGVGQLAAAALGAPQWVSLGAAGLLLLVLAVRLEQARRDAARAVTWLREMR